MDTEEQATLSLYVQEDAVASIIAAHLRSRRFCRTISMSSVAHAVSSKVTVPPLTTPEMYVPFMPDGAKVYWERSGGNRVLVMSNPFYFRVAAMLRHIGRYSH